MQQVVPMDMLQAGEEGRVFQVDGEESLVARLAEMGFREGAHVRMLRPGRPCIVAIDDHRMTFRTDDQALVLVELNTD